MLATAMGVRMPITSTMQAAISVSYTHQDVYKRQDEGAEEYGPGLGRIAPYQHVAEQLHCGWKNPGRIV